MSIPSSVAPLHFYGLETEVVFVQSFNNVSLGKGAPWCVNTTTRNNQNKNSLISVETKIIMTNVPKI